MADAAAQALGAYIHHYNADVNRGAQATGDAFSNAIASAPGVIGDNVGGFVHGLMTGQAPPVAAPAKGGKAAASAPAAPGGAPQYTQAYLNSQPNFVQQAAGNAAPAKGGSSAPAGPAPAPTPLDVIRAAAMNNGGLSLSQLGALSESVSRTVPQQVKPVPLTSKEQAAAQYLTLANDYAIKSAQDPNYGKSQAGAAHQQLMEDLRGIAATPNQINDVATGMPPLQGS